MTEFPIRPFGSPARRVLSLLAGTLAVCLVWLTISPALAVPAAPTAVKTTQPDGSRFSLHLRGDEYFSWNETSDGFAVVKDETDGYWKYAVPAAGRAKFLPIAGARVNSVDPTRLGLSRRALPDADALQNAIREGQRAVQGVPAEAVAPAAGSSSSEAVQPTNPPPSNIPVSGVRTVRNIVILASFADHWNTAAGTVLSSYGRVSVSEYYNLFNEVGHSSDGAVGSVRDYYKEVSYGKLTIESTVTPWVKLPQNESYYGADSADGATLDVNWRVMITDAIAAATAAGFSFAQGDSDGDGWVDGLTVIHSGVGQELSGNPTTCMWSKQGLMMPSVAVNGVRMSRVHTEPALRGAASSTGIIRIGTICHEMGHFFGLPDLYDYSGFTLGLGGWSLMANGSWNGSDGKQPAHFDAWSKCMLGFVTPTPVHSQTAFALPRSEDTSAVGIIRDGMSSGECFLVENRDRAGFDGDALSIFPGIVIYHVDGKSLNNDLRAWLHPAVKIEEADGNNSLGGLTAFSQAGDVWTSSSGLSGGFRDETGVQSANAMLYQAAHAYNRIDDSRSYSRIALSGFSAPGSTMTMDVATLRTVVPNQTVHEADYTVSWPACTQVMKYEIQEGSASNATTFADGAENAEAIIENWCVAGDVQVTALGKRSGSASYLMQLYNGSNWCSTVQSLTMRNPFVITTLTSISFYVMAHMVPGNATLKCEISVDEGATWKILASYGAAAVDPWALQAFNFAALQGKGVAAGDSCRLRFVADLEYPYSYVGFPLYGFAIDDLSITGISIPGNGNWITLANNLTGTTYPITGKADGAYAYRVRAYANGVWQGYGSEGVTTVDLAPVVTSVTSTSPDGVYEPGSVINVTVNFSEAVTLAGGNLVVTLETGDSDRTVPISTIAHATSASGTYTVQDGDVSADLTATSLSLSAGTLVDDAGNGVSLSVPAGQNLGDLKNLVVQTMRTLVVSSSFPVVQPAVGSYRYAKGTSVVCAATNSPAVKENGQERATAESAGWVGTGSVPASGSSTNAGAFALNTDSSIAWQWLVTERAVSNQVVSTSATVEARDAVSALAGYQIQRLATVSFQVGPAGSVALDPGFEASTGSVFSVDIAPAP